MGDAYPYSRKFNTRDAYPEQKLDNDVCMAVRAGNTVYLRGQTAMDSKAGSSASATPRRRPKTQ